VVGIITFSDVMRLIGWQEQHRACTELSPLIPKVLFCWTQHNLK